MIFDRAETEQVSETRKLVKKQDIVDLLRVLKSRLNDIVVFVNRWCHNTSRRGPTRLSVSLMSMKQRCRS